MQPAAQVHAFKEAHIESTITTDSDGNVLQAQGSTMHLDGQGRACFHSWFQPWGGKLVRHDPCGFPVGGPLGDVPATVGW